MNLNQSAQSHLTQLAEQSLRRQLPTTATQSCLNESCIDLSSNDYLGLSQHPDVIQAGQAHAGQFGAGATGSRLLSGNLACFEVLEQQVAEFKHSEAALVFCSGYQANAAALSALLSAPLMASSPLVFTDKLNHASLHHACQRAGLSQKRFRHNDLNHLRQSLHKASTEQPDTPKWIVTESVFGMDGDVCPVAELAELAVEFDAAVYLDEAHATGLFGPQGRGLGALQTESIDRLKQEGRWVVMGTFSKAVGVSGAYIACSEPLKQYLINRCTGFVYSTAPSPFVVGAVSMALNLISQMEPQRRALLDAAEVFRHTLNQAGLNTGQSTSHIVPVIVGDSQLALDLKHELRQAGFEVSAVRPPTVPAQSARIRLALRTGVSASALDELSRWLIERLKPTTHKE